MELNRYDGGQTFALFQTQHERRIACFQNYASASLYADKRGLLWLAGGNKTSGSYNYKTERSATLPVKPGEWFISSIITAPDNQLWITSIPGRYTTIILRTTNSYLSLQGKRFVRLTIQLLFINQNYSASY